MKTRHEQAQMLVGWLKAIPETREQLFGPTPEGTPMDEDAMVRAIAKKLEGSAIAIVPSDVADFACNDSKLMASDWHQVVDHHVWQAAAKPKPKPEVDTSVTMAKPRKEAK